ncbi:hypothetical protein EP47_07395 [Legionella norrlandica]|uniref:Uncharacterized protein n=1 Tax=Legionella norrlandica TaxID=1498499 RepID=A0A0A2SRD1_9GAMM|nr:hypothetical protein [Legionella norrlandica]KGP62276.1 hypothetical protein EP47_07395 [Legionella norrlandica]
MPNPSVDESESSLPSGSINPVPDHRCSSTANFDFYLDDGKIYLRTRTPEDPKTFVRGDLISIKGDPKALEWKLFDGKGIPYNERLESLLEENERIVEIDAASNIVVAVSNLDKVYLYKPTEYIRPLYWGSKLGAPDFMADELFLPHERRAWCFSCSVCKKDEVRKTDFIDPSEIVSFAKDGNGINFDFGFTPTIYVLDNEGQKIVYWDTGLPASFSRGFLVPDGMQGLSISAAGSTVFLSAIDAEEKLHFFTRMIDYEINGACPGLKVSYTETPVVQPPNGSFFLGHGVRKLPLDGWVEHKIDDIPSNLTHKVCIRLTGKGDDARELRILGQDSELRWGYYSKNITDNKWEFHADPAAEPTNHEDIRPIPFNPTYPNSQKMSYEGKLFVRKFPHIRKVEDTSETTIELKNFHPFLSDAEPLSIVLSHPGEPPQTLKIHAVDAWGLHYHHKHDEELIGSVDGEPKALSELLFLRKNK